MSIDTAELIPHALKGFAAYRETHALKGLFAIQRLWSRYPHWPDELLERALNLQESVLNTPRVDGLLHHRLGLPSGTVPRRRWRQNVEIGLFPIAYASIVEWHKAEGISEIVASYKDPAVAAISDLGHSWTIWCSFYEALPYLETETLRLYAAERFAEFVAQQFHKEGRTLAQTAIPGCSELRADRVEPASVISEALRRPGFLGHHLLTLGTLLRQRALLNEQQFAVGLIQTQKMIRHEWNDPAFDVVVTYREQDRSTEEEAFERRLRSLLARGMDNVHTLTLADVAATLWDLSDQTQRANLCRYLEQLSGPDNRS